MANPDLVIRVEVHFIVTGQAGTVMKGPVGAGFPALADASVVGQDIEVLRHFSPRSPPGNAAG
jgi:hypothetical protein